MRRGERKDIRGGFVNLVFHFLSIIIRHTQGLLSVWLNKSNSREEIRREERRGKGRGAEKKRVKEK